MQIKKMVALVALVTVCSIVACKVVSETGNGGTTVKDLGLVAGDVQGWSESAGGFKEFNKSNSCDVVNGKCEDWKTNGMLDGIKQWLGQGGKEAAIIVLDMVTKAQAEKMYIDAIVIANDKMTSTVFPETVATINEGSIGCTAYAFFDKYYFELSFTNYDDPTAAQQTAESFLELFQDKVKQMSK